MKFDLKTPCKDCPFKTNIKPYLTKGRVEDISKILVQEQGTFACHKTINSDDEGEQAPSRREQHCAGALILLEKMEAPNQMMRIAERLGVYDHRKLNMNTPVFDDTAKFIAHFNGR